MTTLHWDNADAEVHKVVVGPYDNNVFVVRCRATGEAVLIDAANEHELLLEMCQRLGVKRVLETHGHGDHIADAVDEQGIGLRAVLDGHTHRAPDLAFRWPSGWWTACRSPEAARAWRRACLRCGPMDSKTSAPRLRIDWREAGGPPVVRPKHRGFGSLLLEH